MSANARFHSVILAALVLGAGCGGANWPDIMDVRHVTAPGGAPRIKRIRDMGQPRLPNQGPYKVTDSDGVGVIGELLLIEGEGLGKQPTVHIGGRATEITARTEEDGIIVRVPTACPAGPQAVEVVTARGRSKVEFAFQRYALATSGERDKVHVLSVTREAAAAIGKTLAVENAHLVRYSSDGSTAYVATGGGLGKAQLTVIDMTAAGGPKVVSRRDLPGRIVVGLAASEGAPLLAVVGEEEVTFFNLRDPLEPSHYPVFKLPDAAVRGRVVAAELDAEGRLFALLLADGNRLSVFDVRKPAAPLPLTTVDLMPDARVPLVRDMRFSIDGETLWIVSGDNLLSLASGPQATRLTAVKLAPPREKEGPRLISVWRTIPVPGASAPLGLTLARGQLVASGATIRLPPERAAVFITGVQPGLFKLEGLAVARAADAKKAAALWQKHPQPGMLVRADVNGGGGPLFESPSLLTGVDLSPDAQLLLISAWRVVVGPDQRLTVEAGVAVTPLWTKTFSPTFIPLGQLPAEQLRPPFRLGEVRIQP